MYSEILGDCFSTDKYIMGVYIIEDYFEMACMADHGTRAGHQEVVASHIAAATSSSTSCPQRSQNKQEKFPLQPGMSRALLTYSQQSGGCLFAVFRSS